MKKFTGLLMVLLIFPVLAWAVSQQVVEIDVKGMTCPFCVYSVEKNLGKLPGVERVQVSLEHKKARVIMRPGELADVERLKKTILEAGFTPDAVTVHTEER